MSTISRQQYNNFEVKTNQNKCFMANIDNLQIRSVIPRFFGASYFLVGRSLIRN
jgi:hypothetical protein